MAILGYKSLLSRLWYAPDTLHTMKLFMLPPRSHDVARSIEFVCCSAFQRAFSEPMDFCEIWGKKFAFLLLWKPAATRSNLRVSSLDNCFRMQEFLSAFAEAWALGVPSSDVIRLTRGDVDTDAGSE